MTDHSIYGLRSVGQYKLYEKRQGGTVDIFISHQPNPRRLSRVKVTRDTANQAVNLPKANFAEFCQQLLEGAKRVGSPNYYEK